MVRSAFIQPWQRRQFQSLPELVTERNEQAMKHFFDSGIEWNDRDEARTAAEIADLDNGEPEEIEEVDEDNEGDWQEENYQDAVFH